MNFEIPKGVEISLSPAGLEKEYNRIFTTKSLEFLSSLAAKFRSQADECLRQRKFQKLRVEISNELPDFKYETASGWTISPIPERLRNRQLDLGDISPSEGEMLKNALKSSVQGIQADFDDGHCPTWANQIKGIYNIISIMNEDFFPNEVPSLDKSPLIIMRPRAWNMNEHNILVGGREIPGPVMDFSLLMFHIGKLSFERKAGPYFYLPKLESAAEAKMWDDIFTSTEQRLDLPIGTIKACVLIENILAAFEADKILFALRNHSFGLNCGIWDYSASIINKFGHRPEFVLPDRGKYVNLDQPFLANYMKYVVSVCQRHGAPVTGGMIPFVFGNVSQAEKNKIFMNILKAKRKEVQMGVNGFLTYDIENVSMIQGSQLFSNPDLIVPIAAENISNRDLLNFPSGGVTSAGLVKNIKVGISFIYSWIADGKGHFVLDGAVEDSATAEISRSQVWQWICHQVHLEDEPTETVTKALVNKVAWKTYAELSNAGFKADLLQTACDIFLELVTAFDFPEFMTTYLYNHTQFRKLQDS